MKNKLFRSIHDYFHTSRGQLVLMDAFRTLVALLLALVVAFIIIAVTSDTPLETIKIFLTAPFADPYTRGMIITQAVPLIFTGVGVCIMVKGGQFNMIGEGAFFAGAFIGAILAVRLQVPGLLAPLGAMLAAGIMMGIVGYVPAKLKAALNVNEFVSSLMLNFIIFWVCMYLFSNVFADPDAGSLATAYIDDSRRLPFLDADNEISTSILFALGTAVLGWIFLYRTKWGYAARMTGENPVFARYTGINTKKSIILVQIIGAAIAGLGGAAFLLGNSYRFIWKALPGYGFDGFIVAIIAFNNPLLVPIAALLIGYLRVGAVEMARLSDVPNEVVYIIQAVIILFIGGQAFLAGMKRRRLQALTSKAKEEGGPHV